MNTRQLRQLNKRVNEITRNKKVIVLPILGGVNTNTSIPSESSRILTTQEIEILQSKGLPIPILIAKSRENELKELLKD